MRLRFPVLLAALLYTTTAFAAPATQPHSRSTVAPLSGVRVERDLAYVPGGDPAQVLDLYLPDHAGAKARPLIVWVHGGGWMSGSKSGCPAVGMVGRGYVVASVEYRFSRKALFPAQIQDCQAAIRWLRAHSAEYHINPDHIGVWGESAGGHLVALLGTAGGKKAFAPIGGNATQSDRVQAVCDFFGPADFNTVMAQAAADKAAPNVFKFNTPSDPYSDLIGVPLGSDPAKGGAVSPVHYVSHDNAPFLILHGTADRMVPFAQSVELRDALKAAGVEVRLQPMPHSDHGGPAFGLPAVQRLIWAFFDKHLKQVAVNVEALPDSAVTLPPAAEP